MITPHFNAIKARIEAESTLAGDVHDTVRIDAEGGLIRDNYVILYRSPPESIGSGRFNAVADSSSELTFIFDVRAVGTSAAMCGAVLDKVMAQLVGFRLVVAGRSCTPIRLESSGRVTADQSVKPFLFYADAGFEFVSRPA